MTPDEKIDNALRFLAALVKPDQQWLVIGLKAEIDRLRQRIAELEKR